MKNISWQCKCIKVKVNVTLSCLTICDPMGPWNSPGQNTGMGSLSLLQGIFPTQRLNPHLLHCWWILYQLSHQGSPRILEWVAYPFSSGSSWPRNRTGVSCIAGGFFTSWGTREAQHPGSQWKILVDNVSVYSSLKTVRQTDSQSVGANEYWVVGDDVVEKLLALSEDSLCTRQCSKWL